MIEICSRCGKWFEPDIDHYVPEKLCAECKESLKKNPDSKARVPLEGGGFFETTEKEAHRMLRFQQLIDAGYRPKEAWAKVEEELGPFEKKD